MDFYHHTHATISAALILITVKIVLEMMVSKIIFGSEGQSLSFQFTMCIIQTSYVILNEKLVGTENTTIIFFYPKVPRFLQIILFI